MKTIQQLLTEKEFVEGVDYSFDGSELIAIEKIRHHEEIPAVMDGEVEVSPAIPAWDETYTESIPSLESLCLEALQEIDCNLVIAEFLKDKEISGEDSLNLDLFLKGDISGWRFQAILAPSFKELYDLAPSVLEDKESNESKQAKITAGKAARETCESVLDLVAGYNLDRELTIEQITQMQSTFSSAESALRAGRPTHAKYFISQIVADDVLVTQEMKDLCLELLEGY